jgi:hypothetical protein
VNAGFSKEIWASGANNNIFGSRSNNDNAMKKPAAKAQTTPILLLNLFMKMPAEIVAVNAIIADTIVGKQLILI